MELPKIDEDDELANNIRKNIIEHDDIYNNVSVKSQNSIVYIKKIKKKSFPFMFYISLSIILLFIILIITYLIYLSLYKIEYTYEEEPYVKPKYSSHKYSSLTFENGLKIILVQVDRDDKAGGAISFDFGCLDDRYNPGYIKLALLSLVNENRIYSEDLENYFGSFGWDIGEFYSSFYFEILGGGFQAYLKTFSELTYLNESDERFNNIDDKDLSYTNSFMQGKIIFCNI